MRSAVADMASSTASRDGGNLRGVLRDESPTHARNSFVMFSSCFSFVSPRSA